MKDVRYTNHDPMVVGKEFFHIDVT